MLAPKDNTPKDNTINQNLAARPSVLLTSRPSTLIVCALALSSLVGCGSTQQEKDFYASHRAANTVEAQTAKFLKYLSFNTPPGASSPGNFETAGEVAAEDTQPKNIEMRPPYLEAVPVGSSKQVNSQQTKEPKTNEAKIAEANASQTQSTKASTDQPESIPSEAAQIKIGQSKVGSPETTGSEANIAEERYAILREGEIVGYTSGGEANLFSDLALDQGLYFVELEGQAVGYLSNGTFHQIEE